MLRVSASVVVLGIVWGCSDSPGPTQPHPDPAQNLPAPLAFAAPGEVPVMADAQLPTSVAFSPDGQSLVLTTDLGISVHDSRTREFVTGSRALHPVDALFSPDGMHLIAAGDVFNPGEWGVGIFPLENREIVPGEIFLTIPGRRIIEVPSSDGSFVMLMQDTYSIGIDTGVVRFSVEGQLQALRSSPQPQDIAISSDGEFVFELQTFPESALHVLSTGDLRHVGQVRLPFLAQLVIPLADPNRMLLVGYGNDRYLSGPILWSVLDWRSSTLSEIERTGMEDEPLGFGKGSPWARIGSDEFLIPTTQGIVDIDLVNDAIAVLPWTETVGERLCCEIAYDPAARRAVLAESYTPVIVGGGRTFLFNVVGR